MRQKYLISIDESKNELKISEFAIVDRDLKKSVAIATVEKASFTFLCAETYKSELIEAAIANGTSALVTSLRTHNIFPIEPYAARIAQSVIDLYNSPEEGSVELFFDDVDLVSD